jgi:hypothetical protein
VRVVQMLERVSSFQVCRYTIHCARKGRNYLQSWIERILSGMKNLRGLWRKGGLTSDEDGRKGRNHGSDLQGQTVL